MNVLLTNDDGIRAPGIMALYDALAYGNPTPWVGPAGRVMVVAPLTVQSAASHGITFNEPLMTREEQLRLPGDRRDQSAVGIAVDGRPADCVKLAVSSLWPDRFGEKQRPDLVVSGINAGANCGINVIYSGTVAAAIEGAFLGVPSIAISLRLGKGRPRFDLAALRARHALDRVFAAGGVRPFEILSINIPATEEDWPDGQSPRVKPGPAGPGKRDELAGDPTTLPPIRVCAMNTHGLIDKYERRVSPAGDVYYWAAGHGLDFHNTEAGTDVDLLLQGAITITPLKFDLTQHASVDEWRRRLETPA